MPPYIKREMAKKKIDHSTEDKIKFAAKEVFHRKGFSATRTRDIAEEAGINLALLNYYFRSKERLFNLIMLETLQSFAGSLSIVMNDPNSTLNEKIEAIVSNYIDMLLEEPNIPVFIMSELRYNPGVLLSKLPIRDLLLKSAFAKQYQETIKSGKLPPISILHFIMNLLGLTVFPFIAAPMIKRVGGLKDDDYEAMMIQRKKLIPAWVNAIMNVKKQK